MRRKPVLRKALRAAAMIGATAFSTNPVDKIVRIL